VGEAGREWGEGYGEREGEVHLGRAEEEVEELDRVGDGEYVLQPFFPFCAPSFILAPCFSVTLTSHSPLLFLPPLFPSPLSLTAYGDIVVLEITENMNSGKTHAFFSWAAENAMVPSFSSSASASYNRHIGPPTPAERRPDFVAKADDDSFVMLGEMEKRLRVLGKSKIYWGCEFNVSLDFLLYASLKLIPSISFSPSHSFRST
jgi:hypothetical protein